MEFVRTTIRLPEDVHELLKVAARESGKSAEAIIRQAIKEVLPKIHFAALKDHATNKWDSMLALRYVQFLPVPFVIKAVRGNPAKATVVYANRAYEREFRVSLPQIAGRESSDFLEGSTIERDAIAQHTRDAIAGTIQQGQDFFETITYPLPRREDATEEAVDKDVAVYRSVRYLFESGNERFLGDFTFGLNSRLKTMATLEELCRGAINSSVAPVVQNLIRLALENSPISLFIKDASSERAEDFEFVWCDQVLVDFAKKQNTKGKIKNAGDIIGKRSVEVFNVSEVHPLVLNDFKVKATGKTIVSDQRINEDGGLRTVVRFPIPGPPADASSEFSSTSVRFIGALSTMFGLSEYVSIHNG